MCHLDLDPCSAWSETWRKARKSHVCSCCCGPIRPGERYLRHFSVMDGDVTDEKMCGRCHAMREDFDSVHRMTVPPGYFGEALASCLDGADDEFLTEDDRRWKAYVAEIEDRRAAHRLALAARENKFG